jgi:hypothetical protein
MLCGAGSLLTVLIAASPAFAGAREYRGRTADNGDIRMELVRRSEDPGLRLKWISIGTPNRGWTCNPGFHDPSGGVGESFTRRDAVYLGADGTFRFGVDYELYSLRVIGTLDGTSAQGRFRMDFHDESGCTTGSVPWAAVKLRRT